MYILGISAFYHDAAAALIKDGKIVAAAEEERFTRQKHDYSFPKNAINFALDYASISSRELDYVVFYEKPFIKFERILKTTFQTFPKSWRVFREAMVTWLLDKLWIKNILQDQLEIDESKILFSEHHLSHAASAFYPSPFEKAAILTIDGVGEWATATTGVGRDRDIELEQEVRFPHSLGLFYSAYTAFLGFRVNSGEGKVMGMAPYGEPRYMDEVYDTIKVAKDGSFQLNMDYFSFHHSTKRTFNGNFVDKFGKPRDSEKYFFTEETGWADYFGPRPNNWKKLLKQNEKYADIAASAQKVLEEILLTIANKLYERTKMKKLCYAGGVALNSVANAKILQETPFEEIFIQPSAGDGGGALGAALWAYHALLGNPRKYVMKHAFYGQEYSESSIKNVLEDTGIPYSYIENDEEIFNLVVNNLQNGKVVGWYQGRFEYGPRALGNRSILADPRKAKMKDIVNTKVKFREPFRPFAPSFLAEHIEDYFDVPKLNARYPARFMLYVFLIREQMQDKIPAITHVDGTGRLQAVQKENNIRYYKLIQRFYEATGIPAVLNTSFNLRGDPIVNTPEEAVRTFLDSEMDTLVMEHYLVRKDGK